MELGGVSQQEDERPCALGWISRTGVMWCKGSVESGIGGALGT